MKEAMEAIKKTGKVRFVGFSTHDRLKAQQIQNATDGGFVDVSCWPWIRSSRRRPGEPAWMPATPRALGWSP